MLSTTTIVLLCAAFFLAGLGWGITLTWKYFVIPARATAKRVMDITMEHLDKQKEALEGILSGLPKVEKDGSMKSPIQIPPKE